MASSSALLNSSAVVTERPGDEPVVLGVSGRGKQHPIEPNGPVLVALVFVAGPFGDLDDHLDLHAHFVAWATLDLGGR